MGYFLVVVGSMNRAGKARERSRLKERFMHMGLKVDEGRGSTMRSERATDNSTTRKLVAPRPHPKY